MELWHFIVAGIIVLDLIFVIVILTWKKKKIDQIMRDMKFSGETFILGPEKASFRGATAKYGRIKGNGVIGLTSEKVMFIPYIGKHIIIPIQKIKDVSESKRFLGHYLHRPILILHGTETDAGFFVKNNFRWQNAIKSIVR